MEFFDNPNTWPYKIPQPGDDGLFYAPCINYPSCLNKNTLDETKFDRTEFKDIIDESLLPINDIVKNNFIINRIIDTIPFIKKSEVFPTSQSDLDTSIRISFSHPLGGRIPLGGLDAFCLSAHSGKYNMLSTLFCMPSLINGWQYTEEGVEMLNKWIDWIIELIKKVIDNQFFLKKLNQETQLWNKIQKIKLNSNLTEKYKKNGLSIVETKFFIIKRNDVEIDHIEYECILF